LGMSTVRTSPNVPTKAEFINCALVLASGSAFLLVALFWYIFNLSKSHVVLAAIDAAKRKIGEDRPKNSGNNNPFWETVLASLPIAVALCNVMVVTFIVLPDQMVLWRPSFGFWGTNPTLYQESVIFGFNVFDVIGRFLAIWAIKLNSPQVISGSFARWLILPCFFLAARGVSLFVNDIVKFIVLLGFGLSYGLLTTWAFTLAPSQPGIKPENAEISGALMSFMGTLGIMLGTTLAAVFSSSIERYIDFAPYQIDCTFEPNSIIVCHEMVSLMSTSPAP
jgi:hypothetical protein